MYNYVKDLRRGTRKERESHSHLDFTYIQVISAAQYTRSYIAILMEGFNIYKMQIISRFNIHNVNPFFSSLLFVHRTLIDRITQLYGAAGCVARQIANS